MRGATVVPFQPHQILRLSRRKTHMLNPHHIWNLIYNARSNSCPPPTSPNVPVTQKDSHAESSSHMKPDLQCAEQQLSVQPHQILCLPRRKIHMLNPHHIWNLIYSARSNRCLPPTSPNIAPVTQQDSHAESSSHMKPHLQWAKQQLSPSNLTKYSFTVRGATGFPLQRHQILRLSRRKTHMLNPHHIWNLIHNARSNSCPSNLTKYCACHAERLTCWILITYETSFTVRGATVVPLQPHQILRLSRSKTHMLNPHHIWNFIYSGRSNSCPPPTSPNITPVTQKDWHVESSSHMKPRLQCAEQQVSPSNVTKYCVCHKKLQCKIFEKIFKNRWNVISNAGPIWEWSDHDPTMKPAVRNPPHNRGYFSISPRAFSIVKYNVSRSILHSNLHQVLHLPQKVTLELHQIPRLPRKVTLAFHQVLRLPRKVTLELHQVLRLPLPLHQVLRLPRKVTLELHQVLRLPLNDTSTSPSTAPATENWRNVISNAGPIREWSKHDPTMIQPWNRQSATRLTTEVTFRSHHAHFLL